MRGRHRNGEGNARRSLRRDAADHRAEPSPRRRQLRHPRLTRSTRGARLPRPRVVIAGPRRLRSTRCSRTCATRTAIPDGCTPKGARRGSRSSTLARRWPRSSAPVRARSCSPRRAPRRRTRRCGARSRATAAPGHVVTTAVEHSSVRDAIARADGDVTVIGVDRIGPVRRRRGDRRGARRHGTRVGAARRTTKWARCSRRQPCARPLATHAATVHVDACAAAGHVPIDFARARRRPLLGHGAQVRRPDRRGRAARFGAGCAFRRCSSAVRKNGLGAAGIENVPAWVGFGAACATIDLAAESAAAARPDRAGRRGDQPRARRRAIRTGAPTGPAARSPTCCASASRASKPSRSCSRSTSTGSRCTPDRRALRRRWNRHRCSRRWVSTPSDHSRVSVGWSSRDSRRRPLRGSLPGNRRTTTGVAIAMSFHPPSEPRCPLRPRRPAERGLLPGGVRLRGGRRLRRRRRRLPAAPRSTDNHHDLGPVLDRRATPRARTGPRRPLPPRLAGRHDPGPRGHPRASRRAWARSSARAITA